MPALRKPYRIAVLAPQVALEGNDAAYTAEAGLLLWTTCVEVLRRHPGLAVYDAESTPLYARDGHFAVQHAEIGATPTDSFFASTRRDELLWLELGLPRGGLKLHAYGNKGERQVFDAIGRALGDQLNHVFGAWLSARGLDPLTRKLSVTGEEVIAITRVIGPMLVERARATPLAEPVRNHDDDDIDAALDAIVPTGERRAIAPVQTKRSHPARMLANRLPAVLRVPALRTLELAFEDDLGDLLLTADPEHPQALFAKWAASRTKDPALLRRVIAASPGWALPYAELRDDSASRLEAIAGAGIAALCRPAQREVVETAANSLRDDGRIDEAVRLVERVVRLHGDPPAHAAFLELLRSTDQIGTWLAAAERAAALHGCCPDPALPRYPDQIEIDLLLSEALLHAGRFHAAITLRASTLDGVEADWPNQAKALAAWRDEPRFAAWCAARESWFAGDHARALDGFGKIELDGLDLAMLLDALVNVGREAEAPLAWASHGLGRRVVTPAARLAAARGSMAAGRSWQEHWRRGLEEMWRVELGEPGRDDQVALAHLGLLLSIMPLEIAEAALAERVGVGAVGLARRMARDIADFIPGAAKSAVVMRALGKPTNLELDGNTLAPFSCSGRSRAAIDALFAELEPDSDGNERRTAAVERRAARRGSKVERPITVVIDPMVAADRLVNRWLEAVYVDASEDEPSTIARAAIYVAAQALGRYLVATTAVPSVNAGALRTVAAEALALVHRYHAAVLDRDVHALFGVIDPVLRRVDRWVGTSWLAAVERACCVDERSAGDLAGFAAGTATVAARILGPEETAVLAASVARLHRERPEGWERAVSAQASRLVLHTGHAGVAEWADATVAELAAKRIEIDDAIDILMTASYLAEGVTAVPCVHAARILLAAGRGPAGFAVLTAGISAASPAQREQILGELAGTWTGIDVPIARERAAAETFEALQRRDPGRAERLGRWVVACEPESTEAHRNLGLALAQQGKIVDALHHLSRGSRDQATQVLAGILFQQGKLADALAVLDHASRWYTRAEQWLGFGGIADASADHARTERAYARAFELDPEALDATQLDAYARACIGVGKLDDAVRFARRAIEVNQTPAAAANLAATLDRATSGAPATAVDPSARSTRSPAFAALDAGDFATAAAAITGGERDWQARRAAIAAVRYRNPGEGAIDVTRRARRAASSILVATVGSLDHDAVLCRMTALAIREQAYFARDRVPGLGDRARAMPAGPRGPDRIVVPGSKVARVADYVALLRDLAALTPREALEQFDLDAAGYLEVARAWTAAMAEDPGLAATISAGLARR